jgi:molybdopterin-containing oxidoreductase family iron-sulfur binding subunit
VPLSRRDFLKGVGVTVGGIGLAATGFNRLIPFVDQPDDIVPGVSTWYATSCRECPAGCSMIVRNRDAHAVKCEGNPLSPLNAGKLCARGQAALQGLYDPDRIKNPLRGTESGAFSDVSWDTALHSVGRMLAHRPRIAFISDLEGDTMESLIRAWLGSFGSMRHITYEPVNYEGLKGFFGVVPSYHIEQSDYLISFGADFLETWISPVEYARKFATMRTLKNGARGRFAYVGPRVSMTAANADTRMIVPPGAFQDIARAIVSYGYMVTADVAKRYGLDAAQLWRIGGDLVEAKSPVALPGTDSDAAEAAWIVNNMRSDRLVDLKRPHALMRAASSADMTSLVHDIDRGDIDVLVIYRANPVYDMPVSSGFLHALERVPTVISLSSFMDETTAKADWVLPSNTPLESWGDYAPYPDVKNLMQPVMGTLFDTRQTGDILIGLMKEAGLDPAKVLGADSSYGYLRRNWAMSQAHHAASDSDWEALVQKGGVWTGIPSPLACPERSRGEGEGNLPATASATAGGEGEEPVHLHSANACMPQAVAASSLPAGGEDPAPLPPPALRQAQDKARGGGISEANAAQIHGGNRVRLWAYPSIYFHDGRGANNRWLQEMAEPVTNGVWGTWVEIHPATAKRFGISTDDVVELSSGDLKITAPAMVWEGVAQDTVAVPIGQGHKKYGRYAADRGANVWALLESASPVVEIRRTGETKWAARLKGSDQQFGREIVQTVKLGNPFRRLEEVILPMPAGYSRKDVYPGHEYKKHRWAMTIDLDKCIGCHACVTACYAENNIGVVGPEQIWRRREMHWIRIDRYTDWKNDSAPLLFQPMLCQHCDAAPCEPVCPVYASSHGEEGVNMQIYNRCVGTRYCSHNCPYKARRFNWFDWDWPTPLNYQLNPDVTVRCRGVMEKCTFCIQRIREAEMNALREKRRVADGEITPACVQTCPTGVFTFGDLKDPDSRVSKIVREDPRAYQVLRELNTKPAVIYLKKIVA